MLPARKTTFGRVYNESWRDVLVFRAKNEFSQCDICYQLKAQLRDPKLDLETKLGSLKTYRQHLHDQYVDRTVTWTLGDLSADPHSDIVVMWLDGMDQAKFALPRDPGLRTPASLSNS